MNDNFIYPDLNSQIQAILNKLKHKCQLRGILLRGSHARGDALNCSDLDLVVFVDAIPAFDHYPGFKIIKYSSNQDEKAILENPVRPLDLRDSKILFDPYGLLENLKQKCINELNDRKKIHQRAKKLLRYATIYLEKTKTSGYSKSLPFITGLVLDASRAILVKNSITPSGRRLLYQVSLIKHPDIETLFELIANTLGVTDMTPSQAEIFFLLTMKMIESDRNINYLVKYGRFLTPERLCYWKEGFYYLIQFNTTAACWIWYTLLLHYFEYYGDGIDDYPPTIIEALAIFYSLEAFMPYDKRIAAAVKLIKCVENFVEMDG